MNFEQDKKSLYERRKNLLYLISQYLSDIGLQKTNSTLVAEANLSDSFVCCDNVDLETIYLEFCSFYKLKFGKMPRIVRKTEPVPEVNPTSAPVKKANRVEKSPKSKQEEFPLEQLRVSGVGAGSKEQEKVGDAIEISFTRPLLSCFEHFTPEWKEMAEQVCQDLILKDLLLSWDHVKGAEVAKSVIYEGVIMPLEYPDLFKTVKPWRSALLHGPPGIGKTMLAKALCSEMHGRIAFFNVTASCLISKWRGESEKLVRVLFDVARLYAPSIVFIDEIDGLTSQRDCVSEHEASKRFKNEFLALIDGLASDNGGVFLLASTNLPWEIDPAFLRRFERKVLIDLPDGEARLDIFKHHLPSMESWPDESFAEIIRDSDSFTGDEIRIACKEAVMMSIRRSVQSQGKERPNVLLEDLKHAIGQIYPTSKPLLKKHREWHQKFGNKI